MRIAIAYVTDTLLCPARGVSGREDQKDRIRSYAAENGIHIAAWFEDEMCSTEPLLRSGFQGMMAYDGPCDLILVDHAWSLSRDWAKVKRVLEKVVRKGWDLDCAQMGWDAVSQMTRAWFKPERFQPAVFRRVRPNRDLSKRTTTTEGVVRPATL